jgi:hypothetical protein
MSRSVALVAGDAFQHFWIVRRSCGNVNGGLFAGHETLRERALAAASAAKNESEH